MKNQGRILVIEDDEILRQSLVDLLSKEGYATQGVKDGPKAIDAVQDTVFDLIVADIRLPGGMDGIETIGHIKSINPDAGTMALVMTGYADTEAPVRALRVGVNDYIYKPFDLNSFLDKVKECLLKAEKREHVLSSLKKSIKKQDQTLFNRLSRELRTQIKEEDKKDRANISVEAVKHMLGIQGQVPLTTEDMAQQLRVTFFPVKTKNKTITKFSEKLKQTLTDLNVDVIPYEQTLDEKGRVQKGIVIIATGDNPTGKMPINHVTSAIENPIVTIIETPKEVKEGGSFEELMKAGIGFFAWYMCQTTICVKKNKWIVFSLSGYSPFYTTNVNFKETVLDNLIPKIATTVQPIKLSDIQIKKIDYDYMDKPLYRTHINAFMQSGRILSHLNLYYPMQKVESFACRTRFYKRIVRNYLNDRTGMSYGFMAKQLPIKLNKPILLRGREKRFNFGQKDFVVKGNQTYLKIDIHDRPLVIKVPPVSVFMTRSGSNKTRLDPRRDIIKMILKNGKLIMEVPKSVDINKDFNPSFDTRLILANALANTIFGILLKHLSDKNHKFPIILEKNGIALVHWHKHMTHELIPRGFYIHGMNNPPVLCSSDQSAVFAFKGKEECVNNSLNSPIEFMGDVQYEEHHGVNVNGGSLKRIAYYLLSTV